MVTHLPASESPLPTSPERPKVIYVMGAGRSGSTILGVVLGNCTNVFDAGELDAWLRLSGIPNFGGSERTRFWSAVRDDVPGGADLFGDQAWHCLEHSLALFRVRDWNTRRRLRRDYLRIAEDLYHAITQAAEVTHIVDTSHYPLRARELRKLKGIDLYLIYLVRDPHRVVASFDRKDVGQNWKPPIATNIYLWLTHLLSTIIFLSHRRDRRLLLRYEDCMAYPENILRSILELVEAPLDPPDLVSLTTGIPFQGNRLLSSGVIALKDDTATPVKRSRITTVLQLPWTILLSRLRPVAMTPTSH